MVKRQKGESGGKKCSFFGKFGVLCFLETPVLKFALLPYYRRSFVSPLFPSNIQQLLLHLSLGRLRCRRQFWQGVLSDNYSEKFPVNQLWRSPFSRDAKDWKLRRFTRVGLWSQKFHQEYSKISKQIFWGQFFMAVRSILTVQNRCSDKQFQLLQQNISITKLSKKLLVTI